MKRKKKTNTSEDNLTPDEIADYLKQIKFRKKFIGGVDEYDVWRKVRNLNEMYANLMENQRIRYEALLEERDEWCRRVSAQYDDVSAEDERNGET